MQHDVITTILHSLSAAVPGVPWLDRHGFTIVPLHASGVADPGSRLRLEEVDPPRADRITAVNGAAPFTLACGTLVKGGWADRVVSRSRRIPAGGRVEVGVEVVSARWWRQGQLRIAEPLDPAEHALLLLMDGDGWGLRSVARTALWTAVRHRDSSRRPRPGDSDGWILLDGERLLAASLMLMRTERGDSAEPRAGEVDVVIDALRRPAGLEPRVAQLGDGVEVTLIRPTLEIPDAILRRADLS